MLFVIVRLDETIDEVLEAVWYGSFCSVGSGGRPGWLDRPLAVLPTTAQRDATLSLLAPSRWYRAPPVPHTRDLVECPVCASSDLGRTCYDPFSCI